jgi:photosystem II stability/assembly factor-like uncharacterized protein
LLAKRVATTRELTVVGTPGLRWRFGVGGSIERSDDEGKSWVAQKSGVTAELLAGACPSPTTCWIVGRNGTVLRTADGQTWSRTTSPDGLDLVGVQASDDRTAIVSTAASGRFRTADAGQTWVRVSPQDF